MDAFAQDLRQAWRGLRRSPTFSVIVVVTLALAIGANTALFSVLNALLFRPLPVKDPERLVVISAVDPRNAQPVFIYDSTFEALRARLRTLETLSLYIGGGLLRAEARGAEADGGVESSTPDYYDMLGVRPFAGRFMSTTDAPARGESAPVVIISHRFWLRQFGGDLHAIGEPLTLEGVPLTVIGVTPPGFHGLYADGGADFSVPLTVVRRIAGDPRRPIRSRTLIGRLRPALSLREARVELDTVWPSVRDSTMPAGLTPVERDTLRGARPHLESLISGFSGLRERYANPAFVSVGLTMVLLVIGCVNLIGLWLARLAARDRQLAIRLALGATRGRLMQQVVVEALVLSLLGASLAVPLAFWTSRRLGEVVWAGSEVPLVRSMTPDLHVLVLAASVALATGLLVGLVPGWLATRQRVGVMMYASPTATMPMPRAGRALLVGQVALSLVLLTGAVLLTKTLTNLRANIADLPARHIIWTRLWLKPGNRNAVLGAPYYAELARQLSEIPGAESAGFSMFFPAYFTLSPPPQAIARADVPDRSGDVNGLTEAVSPGFFDTVGLGRVQGRDFTWQDDSAAPAVGVINSTLALKLFPEGSPLGQHLRVGPGPAGQSVEIVGVVHDAPIGLLREPHVAVVYRPMLQEPQRARVPNASVRVNGDLHAASEAYARVVTTLGRHFVRSVDTLDEQVSRSLLQERLVAGLASGCAGLAVFLAAIGVYGLLSQAVARRTREVGVRMALGATRGSVLRMVATDAVWLTGFGVVLGVPCALAVAPLGRSLLYDVAPNDSTSLISAGVAFVLIALVAGLLPAYRASRVDPAVALRNE